jgi:hypothetical protein
MIRADPGLWPQMRLRHPVKQFTRDKGMLVELLQRSSDHEVGLC